MRIRITVGWNFQGDAEINIIDGKNALFPERNLHFFLINLIEYLNSVLTLIIL
jgi:hypothetical protein